MELKTYHSRTWKYQYWGQWGRETCTENWPIVVEGWKKKVNDSRRRVKLHLFSTGSSNHFPVSCRSFRTRINLKTNKYQDEILVYCLINRAIYQEKMFPVITSTERSSSVMASRTLRQKGHASVVKKKKTKKLSQ